MTTQKTFKRRVRARMARTGESYTSARRMLIPSFAPPPAAEKVVAATGRTWDDWFARLDEWGAAGRTHTEIARRLREDERVASWWSQTVAVAYEQARGLRLPGQQAGGFTATASRTVGVPVERLFEAFAGAAPDAGLRLRTATAPRSSRWDFHDGSTRVNAGFAAVKQGRSRVALSHERLPDAAALDQMKGYWRERLLALKTRLEEAS